MIRSASGHPVQERLRVSGSAAPQGIRFTSDKWCRFLREYNLTASMSRRGTGYANAVAESFFNSLIKEKARRRIGPSREEARTELLRTSGCSITTIAGTVIQGKYHLRNTRSSSDGIGKPGVYDAGEVRADITKDG